MPYSGPSDDKLPPNVKAMPEAKRRKWVKIWNAAFANCRSPKTGAAGSVEKCEAAAFKFANGAVKEMTMEMEYAKLLPKMQEIADRGELTSDGPDAVEELIATAQKELEAEAADGHKCEGREKCNQCAEGPPMFEPLAGATSFAEADSYEEANKLENHIREQEYLFRKISDNIFASEDMSLAEKLAKVKAAATELEGRLEKPAEKGLLDRVKDFVGITRDKANKREEVPAITKEAATPGAFRAFKDAKGDWRWVTLTSNMWRDRDGEIIPATAHEENVAHAERTKDMPELKLWHVPGSRVGVADWADFAHGFLLHSGGFDKGMESVAESLAASKEPLGVSHGFYYEKEDGSDVYTSYRDFEVSVLPLEKAANQWTEFTADNTKEVAMGLSDERRGFLAEHMGEDQVAALEKLLEEKEQDLKDGKVDFKEVLAEAIAAAPAPDPKPAEGGGETITLKMSDEFAKLIEGVTDKLAEIATAQDDQGKAIKALQASDDEKIAAVMAPERKPPANGERPSESKGTEITDAEAKEKGASAKDADDPEGLGDGPGAKGLRQILKIQ